MFWEKFLRFLRGYIEFRAVGGFPERFINLCASNRISVQEIRMFGETILGICGIKDYRKIRSVAKKSGMKVRILKKTGVPFFIRRNRMRKGIIAGFILMIIITAFLSERIWVINVSGNEKIPSEDIVSLFEEMGIKTGIRKDSIDAKLTANEAIKKSDGIMWCAVNVDGCRVGIEIREEIKKEIEEETEDPSNIVAAKSGQIKVIECFEGTPVSEAGSAVEKGDIIVSGAVINKDESVSFLSARANVIARTRNTVEAFTEKETEMRIYTRLKNKYFINFFSLRLPVNFIIYPKENFSFSKGENFLSSAESKLPLGIASEKYACFENKKVKMNDKALLLVCGEKYFSYIDENFDGITVEKMTSAIECDKKGAKIYSVFECVENIGEMKKMDLQIEEESTPTQ